MRNLKMLINVFDLYEFDKKSANLLIIFDFSKKISVICISVLLN